MDDCAFIRVYEIFEVAINDKSKKYSRSFMPIKDEPDVI